MSGSKVPLVYWDTCIFISLLMDEQRDDPGDMIGVRQQMEQFDGGQLRIATCAITITEILRTYLPWQAASKLESIFTNPSLWIVQVDRNCATIARDLQEYYAGQKDDLGTLSTPDALHTAAAIVSQCRAFYTFDGANPKRPDKKKLGRSIISINGTVAGKYQLLITKPGGEPAQQQLPDFTLQRD